MNGDNANNDAESTISIGGTVQTGDADYTLDADCNILPTTVADSITIAEDSQYDVAGLLTNDIDLDLDTLSFGSADTFNNGGSVANGKYTPAANYFGTATFKYRAKDATGESTTSATVTVTISSVNDLPTANADSYTTNEDTPFTLDPRTNDVDIEEPSASLTTTIVTQPTKGTLTPSSGSFTYAPSANVFGSDSFTYKVNYHKNKKNRL